MKHPLATHGDANRLAADMFAAADNPESGGLESGTT